MSSINSSNSKLPSRPKHPVDPSRSHFPKDFFTSSRGLVNQTAHFNEIPDKENYYSKSDDKASIKELLIRNSLNQKNRQPVSSKKEETIYDILSLGTKGSIHEIQAKQIEALTKENLKLKEALANSTQEKQAKQIEALTKENLNLQVTLRQQIKNNRQLSRAFEETLQVVKRLSNENGKQKHTIDTLNSEIQSLQGLLSQQKKDFEMINHNNYSNRNIFNGSMRSKDIANVFNKDNNNQYSASKAIANISTSVPKLSKETITSIMQRYNKR